MKIFILLIFIASLTGCCSTCEVEAFPYKSEKIPENEGSVLKATF